MRSFQTICLLISFLSICQAFVKYQIKRDVSTSSPWFYPEIDKDQISCDPLIHDKLLQCSHADQCSDVSKCFDAIHCPLHVKSYGSFIYNVIRLLGVDHCSPFDSSPSCSHNQRMKLLQRFLSFWTQNLQMDFCNTFPTFVTQVKDDIHNFCPMHLKSVEDFIPNYFCTNQILSTSTNEMTLIDEDDQFNFFNINNDLLNTTEQTIYMNDHQYYNVSYIVPKSIGLPKFYVDDHSKFSLIHPLANQHRSALGLHLKFNFPFYGHLINKILVATGGFLYTGDLLHSALIGSTQYIAPLMGNFDASIGGNETEIKYFDNQTHFICTWKRIYLQDQKDAGPFTFQVVLQDNGNIYFNYLDVPNVKISTNHHAHRIGLSDAYLSEHQINDHIVKVITLYDKINLEREKIHNGVSVLFEMDKICNTLTDCTSCLAQRGQRYNCSWCPTLNKCSDGIDRTRQQWVRAQCDRYSSVTVCPSYIKSNQSTVIRRQSSVIENIRTIFITLLLSVLIIGVIIVGIAYVYAYRHPTSAPGLWLLEHRPSNYIARFKRFTGMN